MENQCHSSRNDSKFDTTYIVSEPHLSSTPKRRHVSDTFRVNHDPYLLSDEICGHLISDCCKNNALCLNFPQQTCSIHPKEYCFNFSELDSATQMLEDLKSQRKKASVESFLDLKKSLPSTQATFSTMCSNSASSDDLGLWINSHTSDTSSKPSSTIWPSCDLISMSDADDMNHSSFYKNYSFQERTKMNALQTLESLSSDTDPIVIRETTVKGQPWSSLNPHWNEFSEYDVPNNDSPLIHSFLYSKEQENTTLFESLASIQPVSQTQARKVSFFDKERCKEKKALFGVTLPIVENLNGCSMKMPWFGNTYKKELNSKNNPLLDNDFFFMDRYEKKAIPSEKQNTDMFSKYPYPQNDTKTLGAFTETPNSKPFFDSHGHFPSSTFSTLVNTSNTSVSRLHKQSTKPPYVGSCKKSLLDSSHTLQKTKDKSSYQTLTFPGVSLEKKPVTCRGRKSGAPIVLAHPEEFKNPSSFLKVYGDPLCIHLNDEKTVTSILRGKNGNWGCQRCGNVNYPRRFRCNKCNELRSAKGDAVVSEYVLNVYEQHVKFYRQLAA